MHQLREVQGVQNAIMAGIFFRLEVCIQDHGSSDFSWFNLNVINVTDFIPQKKYLLITASYLYRQCQHGTTSFVLLQWLF